jgi:hypothetical protein
MPLHLIIIQAAVDQDEDRVMSFAGFACDRLLGILSISLYILYDYLMMMFGIVKKASSLKFKKSGFEFAILKLLRPLYIAMFSWGILLTETPVMLDLSSSTGALDGYPIADDTGEEDYFEEKRSITKCFNSRGAAGTDPILDEHDRERIFAAVREKWENAQAKHVSVSKDAGGEMVSLDSIAQFVASLTAQQKSDLIAQLKTNM